MAALRAGLVIRRANPLATLDAIERAEARGLAPDPVTLFAAATTTSSEGRAVTIRGDAHALACSSSRRGR